MTNKGNYYKRKTKQYFKDLGYDVEYIEKLQRIYSKGKIIFIKRDLFFSDGLSINDDEIIFWQSKLNKKNIADAFKKYSEMKMPKCKQIKKWIIVWTPRAREPEIINVK